MTKTLAALLGLAAVVLAVGVLTVGLTEQALAGKHTFPKMAKATYLSTVADTTGGDQGGGLMAADAGCETGDKLLSGGFSGMDASTHIDSSQPGTNADGTAGDFWVVRWRNGGATPDAITIYALCSDFPPAHTS